MSTSRYGRNGIVGVRDNIVLNGYNTVSPNRFEAIISVSNILRTKLFPRNGRPETPNDIDQRVWSERLNISLQGVDMPGRGHSTSQRKIHGPLRDMPYESLYEGDISMKFLVSHDYFERNFFERWMDFTVGQNGKYSYYDDYISEIQIAALDIRDNVVYEVKLEEAYPKQISAIEFSHTTTSELVNFTVNMAYRKYRVTVYDERDIEQSNYRKNRWFDDLLSGNIITIAGNIL